MGGDDHCGDPDDPGGPSPTDGSTDRKPAYSRGVREQSKNIGNNIEDLVKDGGSWPTSLHQQEHRHSKTARRFWDSRWSLANVSLTST